MFRYSKVTQLPFAPDLVRTENIDQGNAEFRLNTLERSEIHAALALLKTEKHRGSDFQALSKSTIGLVPPHRTQEGGNFLLVSFRHA